MNPSDSTEILALQAFLSGRQDEILESICRLVETESPSGDFEGSRDVVDLLLNTARDIPAITSVERIRVPGYGEHLKLTAFDGNAGNGSRTLLLGHTDTVHPRGTLRTQGVRAEEGRLYGPGIFDMKASCVLALEALRALDVLDLPPKGPVTLLLTCDEESGSKTGRALVEEEARRTKQALVLEPPAPGGEVKTARKGVAMWTVAAQGIAAHAGLNPEAGASAILELARQTERFHSMKNSASGTTFNVGVVSGGTRSNVVAAEAKIEVDVRFSRMKEAQRISELMRNLEPFDKRIRLTVAGGLNRGPLERTEGVVRLYQLAREVAGCLGFELRERSVGGASDGNFVAALGVPVLDGLGPDGDGAHATHEHVLISDIVRRCAMLAGLIASLE
ncbi:MAG: M20 family metallopeptidase [Pyrinomonadaceae bacterium]